MLTLCTMALLEEAANLAHDWTGGFDGLTGITIPPLFGLFEFNPLFPKVQYLYILAVLLIFPAFGLLYHLDQKGLLPEEGVD